MPTPLNPKTISQFFLSEVNFIKTAMIDFLRDNVGIKKYFMFDLLFLCFRLIEVEVRLVMIN